MRRRHHLQGASLVLVVLLCACEEHSFRLVLTYPNAPSFSRAALVELFVGEGLSCNQLLAVNPEPQLVFSPHATQPEVGEVESGLVSFRALLQDSDCQYVLDGCTQARITADHDNVIKVRLEAITGSACAAFELCTEGRCTPADGGEANDAGALPDLQRADSASPDSASSDSASPDSASPDSASPDSTAPDSAAPDSAAPDSAAPDSAAPDSAAPDSAVPDSAPALESCATLGGVCCDSGQFCAGGALQPSADCGDSCCTGGACTGYTIRTAVEPPVVDGLLQEYQAAPAIEIDDPATGAHGVYRFLWDETALYIAVEVQDSDLRAEVAEHDGSLWNDDGLEIMFDTQADGGGSQTPGDYKIIFNLLGTRGDWEAFDGAWEPTYSTAVALRGTLNDDADTDDGYTLELAISWSEWGIAAPTADTQWGLDLSMNDRRVADSYQTVWWNSTGGGMNDPDGYGRAVFMENLAQ